MASVYDRYGRVVYSLLIRITKNPSSAEDLLQEVFLRVWTRAHLFSPGRGSLAVWILCMARNMALDYLRSTQASSPARLRPLETLDLLCCGSPSDRHDGAVANVDVVMALSKLTSNQQRVLELAYFEGCSQSEIAARLHELLGTVKSWMRAGLSCLRTAMNGAPTRHPRSYVKSLHPLSPKRSKSHSAIGSSHQP